MRTLLVAGPPGAGTTTLVRSLLAADRAGTAAAPPPCSLAAHQLRSAPLVLLDAPAHPDFAAQVQAGLRAAGGVLLVIDARAGVDPPRQLLWDQCADEGLAQMLVLTHTDAPGVDIDAMLEICRHLLGDELVALQVPLYGGSAARPEGVSGLLDVATGRLHDYSGPQRIDGDADAGHRDVLEQARVELVEAVLAHSQDEALVQGWLTGEGLEPARLRTELATAVAAGELCPVLLVGPSLGIGELLDLLTDTAAVPAERPAPPVLHRDGQPAEPLTGHAGGPLVAQALTSSPLVHVLSGTLRRGQLVRLEGQRRQVTDLWLPQGASRTGLEAVVAGSVGYVDGLGELAPGQTITAEGAPKRWWWRPGRSRTRCGRSVSTANRR